MMMARTKKTNLKQKLAQALFHLEVAKGKISEVGVVFEGGHEDYSASLLLIFQSIAVLQDTIRTFWAWAWGKVPDNTDSYRI